MQEAKKKTNWILSKEQKDSIVSEYDSGSSLTILAARYGVGPLSIRSILVSRNYQRRPVRRPRKYWLNENAFDVITENSSYWIGFLIADGSVSDKNILSICLAEKDRSHAQKFCDFLGTNRPICTSNRGECIASVSSKKICDSIMRYGAVPRKTDHATVNILENDRHFWRGCMDGDGTLGIYQFSDAKRPVPSVGICGSKEICNQFCDFVNNRLGFRPIAHQRGDHHYQVSITHYRAVLIATLIYSGCSEYLDRKWKIAKDIFRWACKNDSFAKISHRKLDKETTEAFVSRYKAGESVASLSKEYKISAKGLYGYLGRAGVHCKAGV